MSWLGAAGGVIGGLLGVGGGMATNKANQREAQRNREFQERMSSTAYQRSVEDLKAAGLNPAMAYGHPSSSPGGAQAQIGDAVEKGISSAQGARKLNQEMAIARDLATAEYSAKTTAAAANENHAALLGEQARSEQQRRAFEFVYHPARTRAEAARALLEELKVPAARYDAKYSERMGEWRPALGDITSGARAAGSVAGAVGVGSLLSGSIRNARSARAAVSTGARRGSKPQFFEYSRPRR